MQRLNESLSSLAIGSAAPMRRHEYVVRLGVVQVLVRIPIRSLSGRQGTRRTCVRCASVKMAREDERCVA